MEWFSVCRFNKKRFFATHNVQEGDGFIYFTRKTSPINARTDEKFVIEKNEQKTITIYDDRIIVDRDNSANKGTFSTLGVKAQITVKTGESSIEQFGDYNFGNTLLNSNKDVTFTIGNSGGANLQFNVVDDNVVNLSKNTSGYFSVSRQPFANMTITPGSATTFVIRFSPATVGNNFNAEVTIKTNSENNAEFTFRVNGNGSNEYQIGDTGSGGGIIFFAQGGQYKECSGELGACDWTNAVSTAKNHRGGGFTDWHLPDRSEIDLLYQNRTAVGGFLSARYWSSAEYSTGGAYYQNFNGGAKDWDNKTNAYRVRAVRAFSLN